MASLRELGNRSKTAAAKVALASTETKNAALNYAADLLLEKSNEILSVNKAECESAKQSGTTGAAIDRLTLSQARVEAMADSLRQVASLADPVGRVEESWTRPNGMEINKVRVPLGVVGVIYENRPNVTSDVAGLCIKSGNAAFLRGSASALKSNQIIVDILRQGFEKEGLPADSVILVEDISRETAVEFMRLRGVIDCLIPRGGKGLIKSILENATVPFIVDGDGNCHVYIDAAADPEIAKSIVVNAKTQRPGVCNAAETLVIHEAVAATLLPELHAAMPQVELRGDEKALEILPDIVAATEEDFANEFLDFIMAVKVVLDLDGAIDHINRYGTGHTEGIVTTDSNAANRFQREVDAAVIAVNVSTRFTDGGEFGFGAEVGNSTQKLHCRGPMGLKELTCLKYVINGNGQVRS